MGKKKTQKEGRSNLPALNDNDVGDSDDCDDGGDGGEDMLMMTVMMMVTPMIYRAYSVLGAYL